MVPFVLRPTAAALKSIDDREAANGVLGADRGVAELPEHPIPRLTHGDCPGLFSLAPHARVRAGGNRLTDVLKKTKAPVAAER